MSPLLTIAKREFKSYFDSPLAYVVICLSFAGLGVMFLVNDASFWARDRASMEPMFGLIPVGLSMLVIPVVTMGLMAEEKRSGTLEMLITLPVKDSDVMLGKYIGALGLVLTLLFATLVYPFAMFKFPWHLGPLDWGPVRSAYLGLMLFSAASIAIGLLISSLTSSQAIAFFLTFFVLSLLYWTGSMTDFTGGTLGDVLQYVSFQSRLDGFMRGLIDTRDVIYFLSITAVALVVAFRALERRRWA
ncbi:MAG TPA: ABC transporter permease [Polyangiaceae bacterium]|jgi:ABC-2 type transport system permease protein|nr:ABC transporter permease [Polyangiaceae bacterium]